MLDASDILCKAYVACMWDKEYKPYAANIALAAFNHITNQPHDIGSSVALWWYSWQDQSN